MPEFIDPTAAVMTSFVTAVAEFRADRDYPVPWFVEDVDQQALVAPAAFDAYVARVLGERNPSGVRPGFVPMTTLWWADHERFLGRPAIRHHLTQAQRISRGRSRGTGTVPNRQRSARRRTAPGAAGESSTSSATGGWRSTEPISASRGLGDAMVLRDGDGLAQMAGLGRAAA
ncbi:hypothetical protein [Nonomuraea sp. MG754425]|uniref:hypothetical protein n=1 Tax=Nonomuraea sp. MG754425 TaxID=2570319 RepID=UPI001F263738|nr:hypothetical protein [Nonomuraea sp. MG754425]